MVRLSSFGQWKNSVALHLINAPWVIRPGQIDCSVCFLQWALKTLGHPLPITGTLDTLTQASLHSFQMQLGLDRSDIADRSLLQILFQLTRQLQDATIQVSYGFGGKGHGL